jgi:hypothetical protein
MMQGATGCHELRQAGIYSVSTGYIVRCDLGELSEDGVVTARPGDELEQQWQELRAG